jgi:putative heme-binding domain-containing protein
MKNIRLAPIVLALVVVGILCLRVFSPRQEAVRAEAGQGTAQLKKEKPHGIGKRTPWTSSHIKGSPEPPPPYKIVRAFPKLTFTNPLLLTTAPGINRFFVCEQAGKIFSFPIDPNAAKADLVIDLAKELHSWDKTKVRGTGDLYGLAFHPEFAKNKYCYVCYILNAKGGKQLPDGSRISRFRVTEADPPRIDPKSEKVILTWLAGGHNGCDIHFGPDGFLYISTGDGAGPNPPDTLDAGQDLSRLLSKILRIDVDREEDGKPYAIPPDNPFLKTPNARPETWAYGFRNPWRMGFDRQTGDLWVGDVGWEAWEMIYRVQKGGNYGWSITEGPQVVRPEGKRGPTPILPPALALPHTESASITGGYVYRGKRFKELAGVYLCGDWVTRKVWGTRFDGDKIIWHKELAVGKERVVAFGEDHDKEIYIVSHDEKGGIHRLAPNEAVKNYRANFPKKLSETGLFTSVKDHAPAPGVVPFSVNAERWADHGSAERFVALPGTGTIKIYDSQPVWPNNTGEVFFPPDGVLAKTISLELERGDPKSRRRLETQVLHFDGVTWNGYTYAWNDEQSDATLVPAKGLDRTFTVIDSKAPGKKREQRWHYPSRTECLTCHNPWAGYTLAFNVPQLNKNHDYHGIVDNQLRTLQHIDVVTFLHRDWNKGQEKTRPNPAVAAGLSQRLHNPHDLSSHLDERARSYLHVNCSHCHQFGAGGTALIDLRYNASLEQTKALDVRPVQGTFEIANAQLLAPGDPYRSVLYYRMAKLGPGRMPHIGSEIVDENGLRIIRDWIRQINPRKDERSLMDKLRTPNLGAAERKVVVNQLLSSTSGGLMLADAVAENQVPDSVRAEVLTAAMNLPNSQVRELFERFIPDDQRPKRLGSVIRPEQILQKKGDSQRGKEIFFKSAGLQCANCHRIAGVGSTLGPDLSEIAKKYTRAQILESILEPSKFIDPKYVAYLVETTDGKVLTGLLATKTDKEVVLKIAGDKEVHVPANRVTSLLPQQKSLMPELLLRDVTLEQAADLLEFLAGLK